MDACICDIGVDAVKIGMIGSPETVHAVADRLEKLTVPIVFDPVMVATSGSVLADEATIAAFSRLMGMATLVTPNIPELEALGGEAAVLAYGCHLLAKGGHAEGEFVVDRLLAPSGEEVHRVEAARLNTEHTHGTGCTVVTALATGLGSGLPIAMAFEQAVRFTRRAIQEAPGLGQGHGPLGQQFVTGFRSGGRDNG
jgi:hydroxymethylpyrimidine/phosphomethylpyrimidine kinase